HVSIRLLDNCSVVTIVATSAKIPGIQWLCGELEKTFSNLNLWINVNKKPNNVIFGDKFIPVKVENAKINILGLELSVNPASFMQINNEIRDKIYKKVQELIDDNAVVVDVYSGAGVMTGITSKKSKHSYGLEIVPEATEDANRLAKENGIENMTNICGDASKTLPKLVEKLSGEKINVVLDPPRKGCSQEVLDAVISVLPEKIIYISCNSATLARDLCYIMGKLDQYEISLIQPYDMFPQTSHIETMAVIQKRRDNCI
ncbi:MAG: class I SAM-dependent RNA methyltransferase, partial [Clostridia bacterium]|nr:class I SAM-dependent RNA methyltransferase [Clostridia bacterium]